MKPKNCLIFGASGQIGRHLIRKLTKNNYKVTAVTRNLHQKAYLLKTQANAGYLDIVETNIVNETKLIDLIRKTDICINLIGILFEKGKFNTFNNIHNIFPSLISKLCKDHNVEQFIHLSALGIENSYESTYAKSKLDGESNIKKNFNKSVILRPSVVFSVDDNFTTKFMTLLSFLPIFPLYYNGKTKFMPIHCSDLTEVIYQIINKKIISTTIECVGPETISLKNILERLLKMIDKKRLLIPVPLFIAKINAIFFQIFPKPIITLDQLKLLNYDNIASGKYKTNFDLGVPSIHKFDTEVSKYSYMWKEAGEFSKKNGKHIN
jgi:NADH dehydrogenase